MSFVPELVVLASLATVAPSGQETRLAPPRAEARVEAREERVELGQPLELELLVRHAQGESPRIDAGALEADSGWAVLAGGGRTTIPDPEREGLALTRVTWSVVALEPGERELPAPAVFASAPDGTDETIEVARGRLDVRALLLPEEDAPRALSGFAGMAPQPDRRPWWGVAAAIVATLGAAWLLVRGVLARRRRKSAPSPPPTPLQRLEALEGAALDTPEDVREAHFELTRELRAHVDAQLGRSHAGTTDEEWLALVEARFERERAARLGQLFAACAAVKYGAERPTHWAARERIVSARELAGALAPGPEPTEAAR